jgi:hypothetical protein
VSRRVRHRRGQFLHWFGLVSFSLGILFVDANLGLLFRGPKEDPGRASVSEEIPRIKNAFRWFFWGH